MDTVTRLGLWPLRVVWVLLAVAAAGVGADAATGRSSAVQITVAALAWTAWTATLIALLVPRTSSLTVARILVPCGLVAAVLLVGASDTPGPGAAVAIALASVAVLWCFAPWTTDAFVDGSSYGSEQRIALRTPLLIAVTGVLTWTVLVAATVAGPLLLATGQWITGLAALAVGVGAASVGIRAIHQLSRRWLVLVPTGMVLHDPMTMPEPQLFLRQTMAHLGPATTTAADDPETEDLTAGASGLAMELVLDEPVDLLISQGRDEAAARSVRRVLFTPGRPAALLLAARSNRLPVG